ncbi:MAG TPA: class E sortase [Solirubrobacteraceae bacterium]|nr:class E sortase [Solirubrobacteraceae bacterium]
MESGGVAADRVGRRRPRAVADRRSGGGRFVRVLSTVLLLGGLVLVCDLAAVVVWQEPISALYARIQQQDLSGQLARREASAPTTAETGALARLPTDTRRVALLARQLRRTAPRGAAVGRILIPSLGASFVLVNGATTNALKAGPGIYSQTAFPGTPGATTAIAGHRTTYLAPFRHVDRLKPGQTIHIQMPYADFTYAVQMTRIVAPTDFGVIKSVGYQRLVLSACDPPFSASKRIIIFARLIRHAVRGPDFPGAASAATIGQSTPGVLTLGLIAAGVLIVMPLLVYGLVSRLWRRFAARRTRRHAQRASGATL